MNNILFLEAYNSICEYDQHERIQVPLESFITYCIYKYCSPVELSLKVVFTGDCANGTETVDLQEHGLEFLKVEEVPWQSASCVYPVLMYKDTIITGLCAVARHICKYKSVLQNPFEHDEGLLGFRKSCLQAPNEVSIWTKFCEVDIIKTVKDIMKATQLDIIPKNLIRFENHLKKPVKVHNVYKIARDLKGGKINNRKNDLRHSDQTQLETDAINVLEPVEETTDNQKQFSATLSETDGDKGRIMAKNRKWKSKKNIELKIDTSIKIEDLQISHQFAEGPFFTLADLILLPTYHIIIKTLEGPLESLLPLTYRWYRNVCNINEVQSFTQMIRLSKKLSLLNVPVPSIEDVSLYKCDPKRHNPKKRLFTKEEDIENALNSLFSGMELNINETKFESSINWEEIPDGANPNAGHLPDERVIRKSQQLENLALAVLSIANEGDLIVDFCSGSGHLGILIAHLLPKCTIILLENKEQSLLRARERVHEMGLQNVYFFQCNLDFYIGKFDIGIALHACGIASDLVMDKCLKANAKFVLCPCCYGSLHATDRLIYPRSNKFASVSIDKYLCIGHAADQTHEEHPLTVRGSRCMAAIDSDRARLAEEFGYKVTLSKLQPLSCTPKNNLLIGVPS